jgi:hypothetical protein
VFVSLRKGLVLALLLGGCGATVYPAGTTPSYGGSQYAESPAAYDNPFYSELQPYGRWVDHPQYGRIFLPADDFRPYTNGHWEYGDNGFTWISEAPHGWATEHYGRWVDYDGRYAWIPGNDWSPAWVSFYEADQGLGWAPLGPGDRVLDNDYRFVPYERFTARDLPRWYVSAGATVSWRDRGRRVNRVEPQWFSQRNIELDRRQVNLRRLDPNDNRNDRATTRSGSAGRTRRSAAAKRS